MVAFHVQRGVTIPLSAAEFYAVLTQRFSERDVMYFLPEQVAEYDKKRMTVREVLQLQLLLLMVSSIHGSNNTPQKTPDLPGTPSTVSQRDRRLAENEKPLELSELLNKNFLSTMARDHSRANCCMDDEKFHSTGLSVGGAKCEVRERIPAHYRLRTPHSSRGAKPW